MKQKNKIVIVDDRIYFDCPGCKDMHVISKTQWNWNGSFSKPTFSPSVLVTTRASDTYRCHSFVENGRIRFLTDCSHELAGKTVELPVMSKESKQLLGVSDV